MEEDLLAQYKALLEESKKQKKVETCPSCGHCPTCGRRGQYTWPYYQPYTPYWQVPYQPSITWTVSPTTTVCSTGYTTKA